jgi:hypothetical protein
MAAVPAAILTYAFVLFLIMKVNWKLLKVLSVFLVLFAIFYGGYLWLRGEDMTMPSSFRPTPGARRLMSMEGFRFTQSEHGRISWRMHAREADLYETKEARLKDLEITFFTPDRREGALRGSGDRGYGHRRCFDQPYFP